MSEIITIPAEGLPQLSAPMQQLVDRTLAADRKGGEAVWEKALAVADARATAKHGEWSTYLQATGQEERAARRLIDIAERGRAEPRFRDMVITGWLTFSVAAIVARAEEELLNRLIEAPLPPTVKTVQALQAPPSNPATLPDLTRPAPASFSADSHARTLRAIRTHLLAGPGQHGDAAVLINGLPPTERAAWTADAERMQAINAALRNRNTDAAAAQLARVVDVDLRERLGEMAAGAALRLGLAWPPKTAYPAAALQVGDYVLAGANHTGSHPIGGTKGYIYALTANGMVNVVYEETGVPASYEANEITLIKSWPRPMTGIIRSALVFGPRRWPIAKSLIPMLPPREQPAWQADMERLRAWEQALTQRNLNTVATLLGQIQDEELRRSSEIFTEGAAREWGLPWPPADVAAPAEPWPTPGIVAQVAALQQRGQAARAYRSIVALDQGGERFFRLASYGTGEITQVSTLAEVEQLVAAAERPALPAHDAARLDDLVRRAELQGYQVRPHGGGFRIALIATNTPYGGAKTLDELAEMVERWEQLPDAGRVAQLIARAANQGYRLVVNDGMFNFSRLGGSAFVCGSSSLAGAEQMIEQWEREAGLRPAAPPPTPARSRIAALALPPRPIPASYGPGEKEREIREWRVWADQVEALLEAASEPAPAAEPGDAPARVEWIRDAIAAHEWTEATALITTLPAGEQAPWRDDLALAREVVRLESCDELERACEVAAALADQELREDFLAALADDEPEPVVEAVFAEGEGELPPGLARLVCSVGELERKAASSTPAYVRGEAKQLDEELQDYAEVLSDERYEDLAHRLSLLRRYQKQKGAA